MSQERLEKKDFKETEREKREKAPYTEPKLKKYHNLKAAVLQDEGFIFSPEVPPPPEG